MDMDVALHGTAMVEQVAAAESRAGMRAPRPDKTSGFSGVS